MAQDIQQEGMLQGGTRQEDILVGGSLRAEDTLAVDTLAVDTPAVEEGIVQEGIHREPPHAHAQQHHVQVGRRALYRTRHACPSRLPSFSL